MLLLCCFMREMKLIDIEFYSESSLLQKRDTKLIYTHSFALLFE